MTDPKKLLNEMACTETEHILEESKSGYQYMYICGPFLQAEDRNRNGRIYKKALIEREVNGFQSLIKTRESLGELNHPDTGEINPKQAAILITNLDMDGNVAMGKAKVLRSANGRELQTLIEDGVRMGVSSRGTGNLLDNNIVADDFHLITIDAVYMPSAQIAYTDAIYESVQKTTEWVLNESKTFYVEREIIKENNFTTDEDGDPVEIISPEKAETIAIAAEKFYKKIDRKGSKEIKNAFKDWFKTL